MMESVVSPLDFSSRRGNEFKGLTPEKRIQQNVSSPKRASEIIRRKSVMEKIRGSLRRNLTFNFFKNELKENEEAPFKMSLWEYVRCKIGVIFRFKGPSYRLVHKAEQVLIEELDIIRLLIKLHEIEKLKILLMNEDQLLLFDSITKPMIDIEDENVEGMSEGTQMITKIMKKYKGKKDLDEIMKSYKTIRDNQDNNPLNKKLISLLSYRIKKAKFED